MKVIFILLIAISSLLRASSFFVLGTSNNQTSNIQEYKNTIVWSKVSGKYSASKPMNTVNINTNSVYALVNNDKLTYQSEALVENFLEIKKGWNKLVVPKGGIDLRETFFLHKEVKFVYVYDKPSSAWAGFSSEKYILDEIKKTRILLLLYVEEGKAFYLYSTKKLKIKIVKTKIATQCQKLLDKREYNILNDSGTSREATSSVADVIALKSRYYSHYKRGIYNDTRVMMFYPRLKNVSKKELQYGPASPKISIKYSESYAEKEFFVYDYFKKSCYRGVFPSKKIPPFSTLVKLKEG